MRFSFWPGNAQPIADVFEICRHADRTGWERIYFADHFLPFQGPETGEIHECWATLAGLAATLPRAQLGALVTGNTYRHPAVLAKMAVTIDHICGGRFVVGLGAGWQENEHRAYGIPFPSVTERLDRLDEACQVIVALRRNEISSFDGRYYRLDDAPLSPKPLGGLPLLIGGGGEKRTLRIAATHADEWNIWATPDEMVRKSGVLDRHCADVGRDPAEIARSAVTMVILSDDREFLAKMRARDFGRPTLVGTVDEARSTVQSYADAGVDELVVPDFTMPTMERKRETLDRFIEQVAAEFR